MALADEINFDDMPDDPDEHFIKLEQRFSYEADRQLKRLIGVENEQHDAEIIQGEYMASIIAMSKELGVLSLANWKISQGRSIYADYQRFKHQVAAEIVRASMRASKAKKVLGVFLEGKAKAKIHNYLEKIRELVEASDLPRWKKDAILKRVNLLASEVDKGRSRLEALGELLASLVTASKTVREEAAKWIELIVTNFGEAQTQSDEQKKIPQREAPKQIEGPKGANDPESDSSSDLVVSDEPDDEIPF